MYSRKGGGGRAVPLSQDKAWFCLPAVLFVVVFGSYATDSVSIRLPGLRREALDLLVGHLGVRVPYLRVPTRDLHPRLARSPQDHGESPWCAGIPSTLLPFCGGRTRMWYSKRQITTSWNRTL